MIGPRRRDVLDAIRVAVVFQTCMFSETVDDFSLDTKVWPRAAALAERLWADPSTDALAAEYRYPSNC